MPRDRVVIVGAGVAGLVSAFALAARGLDVTVVERSTSLGGKMRQVAVGPSLIDSGPTVFTMRWVFEELFAAAGQNFADHVCLRPLEVLARHAWDEHTRLDLFAEDERTVEAIGDFAGATEADGYRAFCRDTKRIYDILEKPFLRASQPSMGGLIGADGFRGLIRLPQIRPFSSMWSALGQYFLRSSTAPTVRALCHLLRFLAFSGARDLDAGGACGARGRLEYRRRHARLGQGAGGRRKVLWRHDSIWSGGERSPRLLRTRRWRQACERRTHCGRRRYCECRCRRGRERPVRHPCPPRRRGDPAPCTLVVRDDLECGRNAGWISVATA
jgi:hypothetical protein